MLHIILFILKIIGVILLSVLGLLLALLLIVLFVPVRYQLRASHGEALYLKGTVSWLLHLVQISVTHIDGVLHIRARILGFLLYDNLKPRKPKRRKAKRKSNKKNKKPRILEQKSLINQDDTEKAEDNNSEDIKTEDLKTEKIMTRDTMAEKIESEGIQTEDIKTEDIKTEGIIAVGINTESDNSENARAESTKTEDIKIKKIGKLLHKLMNIPKRWKTAYRRVCDKLQSIRDDLRNKWNKLKDIIKDIRHKWNLIYDFWMDELNKQGMKYSWKMIKKLLKHIMPTKLKSELIIGTGDPYSTGQVFSVICFFYGFYGDKVSFIPDFENSRFEGQHYAKGRIRTATILIIACRLLIDKRFKYLKKNFLILKEAL